MAAQGGYDMNKPSWWQNNLTLGNAIVLATIIVGGGMAYGRLESKIETLDSYRAERSKAVDARFDALTIQTKDLPALTYRVTSNEEALKATNARIDASLQTLSERIAEMNRLLGGLDTKVAVLTQRIEMQTPQRRAEARQAPP